MMQAQYKRPDGTFVVQLNGNPYHVTEDDPLFQEASDLCLDAPFEPLPPVPDAAEALAAWRAAVFCSRMQGILALGESRWSTILQYQSTATWSERIVMNEAAVWLRNSQDIAFFAYLLNLNDDAVDDLFRAAVQITE